MEDNYDIGTLCHGKNFKNWPEYNQMECIVIEPLMLTIGEDFRGHSKKRTKQDCYGVHWANGDKNYVPPKNLERKRKIDTGSKTTTTRDYSEVDHCRTSWVAQS